MSGYVVDPADENLAVLPTGELGVGIRIAPAGSPLEAWKDAPIVGYADVGQFRLKGEEASS